MEYFQNLEQSQNQMPPRKVFSRLFLSFFVLVVAYNLFALLVELLLLFLNSPILTSPYYSTVLTIISLYAVATPCAYLIYRTIPKGSLTKRNLSTKNFFLFLFMGFTLLILGSTLGQKINELITTITGKTQGTIVTDTLLSTPFVLMAIYSLVIAPIMEEYLFRKVVIDRLSPYGQIPCVLFSALAFGMFHGNLEQFFYAFFMGLLFAYIYYNTNNLKYTIIMHSIVNFFGGVFPALIQELYPALSQSETYEELFIGGQENLTALILLLVSSFLPYLFAFVGFIFFTLYGKKLWASRGSFNLPYGTRTKTTICNVGFILFSIATIIEMMISIFLI